LNPIRASSALTRLELSTICNVRLFSMGTIVQGEQPQSRRIETDLDG
jgi:hypothetical protein